MAISTNELENFKDDFDSEMQEIISVPPHWLISWGLTIFFFILILIILLSAIIKYPDIIRTSVKVVSENVAKPVISKTDGVISKLIVRDKQYVKKGQVLAFIDNNGNHEQILELAAQLKLFQNYENQNIELNTYLGDLNTTELGELQSQYRTFYEVYLNYRSFFFDGLYAKRKLFFEEGLNNIRSKNAKLNTQIILQNKELEIAKDEFEMHKALFDSNAESKSEFKSQEAKLIAKSYPIKQLELELLVNENAFSNIEKELFELNNNVVVQKGMFSQALNNLISEIDAWKQRYTLIAPQSGKVVFMGVVQEGLNIDANKEMFYIDPGNVNFYIEMYIPQEKLGKIRIGQEVLINLKSFPFEEFGNIEGEIETISSIPSRDSLFISKVKINSRNDMFKKIILSNGLVGDAKVITADLSLLRKFLNMAVKLGN